MAVKLASIFKSLIDALDGQRYKDAEEWMGELAEYPREELEKEIVAMGAAAWMFLDEKLLTTKEIGSSKGKKLILDIFSCLD